MAPILFFGGQGGGKKKKSSLIELGHMLSVEIAQSGKSSELYRAKEYTQIWHHEKIRLDFQAFYLLCLYLEIIKKMAPQEDLYDDNLQMDDTTEGLFRVLSNAIFHLEARLEKGSFHKESEFLIFLGKLLIEQGVFPERSACCFCEVDLQDFDETFLIPEHGGFSCPNCVNQGEMIHDKDGGSGREIWELLGVIANHKYQELEEFKIDRPPVLGKLFHFFCFQFNFKPVDFKSLSMIL